MRPTCTILAGVQRWLDDDKSIAKGPMDLNWRPCVFANTSSSTTSQEHRGHESSGARAPVTQFGSDGVAEPVYRLAYLRLGCPTHFVSYERRT